MYIICELQLPWGLCHVNSHGSCNGVRVSLCDSYRDIKKALDTTNDMNNNYNISLIVVPVVNKPYLIKKLERK